MFTFEQAKTKLAGKSDRGYGKRHKLQNNTYLVESGDEYAVRLHHTNIVTIHRNGTYTLNTGGWDTVTTKGRINSWSPARLNSQTAGGTGSSSTLCVWHSADSRTEPKIQQCRKCHGSGNITTPVSYDRYGYRDYPVYETTSSHEWLTERDGETYSGISARYATESELGTTHKPLRRDGNPVTGQPEMINVVGQVKVTPSGSYGLLREPIRHDAHTDPCYNCDGTGRRDVGSKPNPVIFYDGITVDGTGKVTDPHASRLIESPADKQARLEREAKSRKRAANAARRAIRTGRADWMNAYQPEVSRGKSFIVVYKAVTDDLRSGWDFKYPIGQTVEACDWEPTIACGNGLHFCRTPDLSRTYQHDATRYLACEVDARHIVALGNKIKAQRCTVLYEVNQDGTPVGDNAPLTGDAPLSD